MIFNLSDIKKIRKKLGLTQTQLAKKAGVSQSLIAKIEADVIDPTFSKVEKIFETLKSLQHEEDILASDLMNKNIVKCHKNEKIKDVIKKMKVHEISQMPVFEDKNIIGLITESNILNQIIEKGNSDMLIGDIMAEPPPIISKHTNKEVISTLLKYFPLLVVQEKGHILGVVTKSDLLRKIYK